MISVNPAAMLKIVGTIDPQVLTSGAFSDVIDMSVWEEVFAVLLTGDMAANATMTFEVFECDYDGGNAGAAFKSATPRGANATANDAKQIVMGVAASELALGKQFIKFGSVIDNTGGPAALVVFGVANRYDPGASPVDDTQSVQMISPSLGSVIETVF